MNVSIIGTGYVGVVTGCLSGGKGASSGTSVDIDPERVAALNRAESPIFETGLDELLRKHVGRTLQRDHGSSRCSRGFGTYSHRCGDAVQ